MVNRVTLNSGVTLYFNGRSLVGYEDPDRQMSVDVSLEKKPEKTKKPAEPKPAPAAAKAENTGFRWKLLGTYPGGGGVGCGGDPLGPGPQTVQLYNGGVNITPTPDAQEGDGGVEGAMALSSAQIFPAEGTPDLDPTGERYVIKPIEIQNVHLWGENLSQVENLYIVIESDPTLIRKTDLNPEDVGEDYNFGDGFACVPGMINLSTTDPVADANYDFIRLPLSVTQYTITENRTKEVEASAEGYNEPLGAVCGEEKSGKPVRIKIPKNFYADNQLNINLNLTIEVDATNVYNLNTRYLTYLRIRLVAE